MDLSKIRTRGGVQKTENFAEVICTWPLRRVPRMFWKLVDTQFITQSTIEI